MGSPEETPNIHWADHVAQDLIHNHPEKHVFVCASGISPSGVIHIGNFRETITVDFVGRALKDRGKKVTHLHVWDEYDALRKIPPNLPNGEILKEHMRKPLTLVPDPFGDCPSYAVHFEKLFQGEIERLGIHPEYVYQAERYERGYYNEGIRTAKRNESRIKEILNSARTEHLPEGWTCISIFCGVCHKDTTELLRFEDPSVFYHCKTCRKDLELNMDKGGGVKLLWRIDWPMRWAKEGVDFEPAGKDHSSQGGSHDTGKAILQAVWNKPGPYYLQYDFVIAKGLGAKLSSSAGQLITISETLEIYEPQVIRWIFASRKPNIDFSIAFDLDVMKAYDDFDRTERIAWKQQAAEEKKYVYEKRIYELSMVEPVTGSQSSTFPAQFAFRHLCNMLQTYEGDIEKTKQYFKDLIKTKEDEIRFDSRAIRAWKWVTRFAPSEFRFSVREGEPPKTKYPDAVRALVELLNRTQISKEEEMASRLYDIMKKHQIEPKAFFQEVYTILIDKTSGPKLVSFLLALGPKRASEILERAC